MKITYDNNSNISTIEYNDEEWDFIDTLPEAIRRQIYMGIVTPYDFKPFINAHE